MIRIVLFVMTVFVAGAQGLRAQWVQINEPPGDRVANLAVSGTSLFAGAVRGVFVSSDNGTSWEPTGLTIVSVSALAASGTYLLAGTYTAYGCGAFLSSNNGVSWTEIWYPYGTYDAAIGPMSGGVNLFLASSYNTHTNIVLSTDNGATWKGIYSGWYGGAGVHASAKYIFTYGPGSTLAVGGVRFSSDNGTTWSGYSDIGMPNAPLTGRIQSFAVIPSSGGKGGTDIFAATLGGVLRSSDNGTSWTRAGLTDIATYAIEASGTELFAGTGGYGVYCSTDGGTSWTQVNDGLPNGYVGSLVVSGTHLYAGPRDAGWWRRPLSEMIWSRGSATEFSLIQNYPNPFNGSTTIRYSLPVPSHVTLTVFNALGQQVAQLINSDMEAGNHDVAFEASGLASGVYLYRLKAGNFVQTRGMLVLK